MYLDVTILGSGSALPVPGRHPAGQLVSCGAAGYLVDCGEGTQYRLRDLALSIAKIRVICISHLHGDHYYGLFGLLDTMALTGRKKPLYIIGPERLKGILLEIGRATRTPPSFPIHFVDTRPGETGERVYSDEKISVETFPLDHGIPCTGFLFRGRPAPRNMRREKLFPGLPHAAIRELKAGNDVYDAAGNLLYSAGEYTLPPPPVKTYAYCSDTVYAPGLVPYLAGTDLLYHEATVGEDLASEAPGRGHSTASQAALFALQCGVKKLLIGHFSARYKDTAQLLGEAREIFPETCYAQEGEKFRV